MQKEKTSMLHKIIEIIEFFIKKFRVASNHSLSVTLHHE